jgi:hypothetical protein
VIIPAPERFDFGHLQPAVAVGSSPCPLWVLAVKTADSFISLNLHIIFAH